MATNGLTLWLGSREFVTTAVLDERAHRLDPAQPVVELTSYEVSVLPFGRSISTAVWHPVETYDGDHGTWVEGLPVGAYLTFARVGSGAPNERSILALGVFSVRER